MIDCQSSCGAGNEQQPAGSVTSEVDDCCGDKSSGCAGKTVTTKAARCASLNTIGIDGPTAYDGDCCGRTNARCGGKPAEEDDSYCRTKRFDDAGCAAEQRDDRCIDENFGGHSYTKDFESFQRRIPTHRLLQHWEERNLYYHARRLL